MRVVFIGTSEFAVASLTELAASAHSVLGVVTQADKPSGRGRKTGEPPVKRKALELGLPVIQPVRLREPLAVEEVKGLGSADALVVVAYGQKIPGALLSWPPYGVVNVHGSMLPRYRGAAPIQRAVMNGETVTGVTTMLMDEGWDTGDILLQEPLAVELGENAGELSGRLAEVGARLLVRTLDALEHGKVSPVPQDHSVATYAPAVRKEDGVVDWNAPAAAVSNLIRGVNPRPGAFAVVCGVLLKILSAGATSIAGPASVAGEVLTVDAEGITVGCGEGAVILNTVQPASRNRMPAADFARGAGVKAGDQFVARSEVVDFLV